MNKTALQTAFFSRNQIANVNTRGYNGANNQPRATASIDEVVSAKIDLSEVLFMVHKVVKGDTLLKIAATYKTTPQEIMKLNPIVKDKSHIEIGWELKIPTVKPAKIIDYTVLAGDNLTRISKMYNTTIEEIVSLNPSITNPNLIRTNTILKVPDRRKK